MGSGYLAGSSDPLLSDLNDEIYLPECNPDYYVVGVGILRTDILPDSKIIDG